MKRLQMAFAAAVLGCALSANASLTVKYTGSSPSEIINVQSSGSISFNVSAYAGVYNLIVDGVSMPSFCIDVDRDISPGQTLNNYMYASLEDAPLPPAGPMGSGAAMDVAKLWAAYFSPTMTAAEAAALQLAIWERIDDGQSYTVSSSTAAVQGAATTLLNNLNDLTVQANLVALVSETGQNFVVATPVPEPTTVIAGVLLLLPFGVSTLKVLRKRLTR